MSEPLHMIKLSSNPGNVAKVEVFIQKLAQKYRISPDVYGNMLISLTEAVTNAIRHGNHNDESKMVAIQIQKRKDYLSFMISDEGRGFDYNGLPDPTAPENLLKIGGRGVFLMRELCDSISFYNNGSTVEMQFQIN